MKLCKLFYIIFEGERALTRLQVYGIRSRFAEIKDLTDLSIIYVYFLKVFLCLIDAANRRKSNLVQINFKCFAIERERERGGREAAEQIEIETWQMVCFFFFAKMSTAPCEISQSTITTALRVANYGICWESCTERTTELMNA